MLRSENVLDDEVVGEAGEGFAQVSIACAREYPHRGSRGKTSRTGWHVRVVVFSFGFRDSEIA